MRISDWSSDVCSSDLIGVEVEAVRDAVGADIIEQSLLQDRVVVAIVQRRAARQEVEVAPALIVVHPHAFGLSELARHRAGVAAYRRFPALIARPAPGRAPVCTPVTNAPPLRPPLLEH